VADERSSRSTAQRAWLALSISNVWPCGVACAEYEWVAAIIATFFAVVCWGMSSARVMAIFDGEADGAR
jgi:hypothetical protein